MSENKRNSSRATATPRSRPASAASRPRPGSPSSRPGGTRPPSSRERLGDPSPRSRARNSGDSENGLGGPIPKGTRSAVTRRLMLNNQGEPQKVFYETVCRVLDQCQSCPLLDLDYRDQISLKTSDFQKKLAQSGLKTKASVTPCLPSPDRLGYRHTAKLAISEKISPPDRRFISIGLYKPGTHYVVDIGQCPIQNQRLNQVLSILRVAIRENQISIYDERSQQGLLRYVVVRTAHRAKDTLITLVVTADDKLKLRPFARMLMEKIDFVTGVLMHVNDTKGNAFFQMSSDQDSQNNSDTALGGQTVLLTGQNSLRDSIANLKLRISATSFFQINPAVAEQAYFRMLELISPRPGEQALDLYCGVGPLALLMARSGARVTAIEETESSLADAHENALANGLTNVNFRSGQVEKTLPELMKSGALTRADVITVNPSRRGCQPEVLKAIAQLKPRAVAYMSCNPDTLLRDLRMLEELGLHARTFELYDMFPGSRHCEVVTLLTPS